MNSYVYFHFLLKPQEKDGKGILSKSEDSLKQMEEEAIALEPGKQI